MLHRSLADYVDGRDAVRIVLTQRWLVIHVEQCLRMMVALPSLTQTVRSEIVLGGNMHSLLLVSTWRCLYFQAFKG